MRFWILKILHDYVIHKSFKSWITEFYVLVESKPFPNLGIHYDKRLKNQIKILNNNRNKGNIFG